MKKARRLLVQKKYLELALVRLFSARAAGKNAIQEFRGFFGDEKNKSERGLASLHLTVSFSAATTRSDLYNKSNF